MQLASVRTFQDRKCNARMEDRRGLGVRMSARLLACLVLTLIGAVRSSPALLGTSRHTEEQSTSCESSAPGNGGQLALSTSESSTSNQQSHQGKATLSYTVRWHVVTKCLVSAQSATARDR